MPMHSRQYRVGVALRCISVGSATTVCNNNNSNTLIAVRDGEDVASLISEAAAATLKLLFFTHERNETRSIASSSPARLPACLVWV